MDSNLAPDPLHVYRLILLTVQPHQTRNILLPGLVLAYDYVLLPVPLPAPLRDPLHLAIPVQPRNIPLTLLDIPLHPPNIPQIPPDIHLQTRVTVQLPLNIRLQARLTVQLPPLTPLLLLNIHLQGRLTVQFPPLTPLLPLNIHLQARLTVQLHPLTPQLPLQVRAIVQLHHLNWVQPLNLNWIRTPWSSIETLDTPSEDPPAKWDPVVRSNL